MGKHGCLVFLPWLSTSDCPSFSLISQTPLIFTAPLWRTSSLLLSTMYRDLRTALGVCPMAGSLVPLFALFSVHPDFPFTFWAVISWCSPPFLFCRCTRWCRSLPQPAFPTSSSAGLFPSHGPDVENTATCLSLLQDPVCFCTESKESSNTGGTWGGISTFLS